MDNKIITILTEIKSDVNEMKAEQESIKVAVLETNDRLQSMESIQESQQQIIELLSSRSIEQEADIKDLKLKSS